MANINPPTWATELNQKLDRVIELLEAAPPAQPSRTQPTFCGYRCSWDIDDAGWPSYVHLEDGSMASHREKQGHHWYSASLGDGQYGEHVLKFLRATPPDSLLVMPSQTKTAATEAPVDRPDEDTPFDQADESRLRDMHQLGRQVYGDAWAKHGRALILAQSDGRTETSAQLTPDEAERIISLLRQGQKERMDEHLTEYRPSAEFANNH